MKICITCEIQFTPRTREAKCKECCKKRRLELISQNPEYYKEKKRLSLNKWRNENREYVRTKAAEKRLKNPEQHRKHCKTYNSKNKQKISIKNKKYRKERPDKVYEHLHKRRIRKLQRSLNCIDIENVTKLSLICKEMNKQAGYKKYEVDHIIPLKGKNVSGLHVSWNMQIITKIENNVKKNKFDGTYENESWKNDVNKKEPDFSSSFQECAVPVDRMIPVDSSKIG